MKSSYSIWLCFVFLQCNVAVCVGVVSNATCGRGESHYLFGYRLCLTAFSDSCNLECFNDFNVFFDCLMYCMYLYINLQHRFSTCNVRHRVHYE